MKTLRNLLKSFKKNIPNKNQEMRYFKRLWEESRGDEYDDWGAATYYFEVDEDGCVIKQMELYKDGHVLKYDQDHQEDEYGFLTDQPLDLSEFKQFTISEAEFYKAWNAKS